MRTSELTDELEAKDEELRAHGERTERGREALEMEYYRAVNSETKRWKAQEQRLMEQVDDLRRKLTAHRAREDNTALSGDLERRLGVVTADWRSCEEAAAMPREIVRLEGEELNRELIYL